MSASAEDVPPKLTRKERVADVAAQLNLSQEIVFDLLRWYGTEVVVVIDDSKSMVSISNFETVQTRWEEMQERLDALLQLLLVINEESKITLQFLNSRNPNKSTDGVSDGVSANKSTEGVSDGVSVSSAEELRACWKWAKPNGGTPLLEKCEPYLCEPDSENERLLLVLTDGEPTDCSMRGFENCIRKKSKSVFVNFVLCTNEPKVVRLYNQHMDKLDGVDVIDDFSSESAEVQKKGKIMTLNQYLAKTILGPKFKKYDMLDEGKNVPATGAHVPTPDLEWSDKMPRTKEPKAGGGCPACGCATCVMM